MSSFEESSVIDADGHTISSVETTSNPPKSHETMSVFGESSCGEPLFAQHLRINFTPSEEIDNDVVQRKCVAFWEFINTTPEIKDLMVMPEPNQYTTVVDSGEYLLEVNKTDSDDKTPSIGKTAVSMLEFVEGKGLIDRTFEAKLPRSRCSSGFKDYREGDFVTYSKPVPKKSETPSLIKKPSTEAKSSAEMKKLSLDGSPESTYAKKICNMMNEWDSMHEKVMDPPGHPPALHHCVMQRKPS